MAKTSVQLLAVTALAVAALLAPHHAAAQPAIVSSYITVATTSKVFDPVSDCNVLWGTLGVTLQSLTAWQFINYTCTVPTGPSCSPSIILLTLNYNGTLGNPWSGLTNNVGYLNMVGFQSFFGAIGPYCSAQALYTDTLNGQYPGQVLSACTPDKTSTDILRPGFPCNQTLTTQGTCPAPAPPSPSPPPPPPPSPPAVSTCLVLITATRPAGSGYIYDQNCRQLISLSAPWFQVAGTNNDNNFCLDPGAYSSQISYAATIPSNYFPAVVQGFMANTITANVIINQIPLTCGGTITMTSNCSPYYQVISQATVPLAYSSPRQCSAVYGRKLLKGESTSSK